jgi:hypothetical protein
VELEHLLTLPTVPLPDTVKIGHGIASWYREPDGRAWIELEGHKEDRQYARMILASELEFHGIELFSFNVEDAQLQKTADWNDVMNKAKRINQSGQVMILRNGSQYIVANVQGDHGSYEVEIQRQDPNSRVITGWSCECQWSQYAFDRTRKWKKYESRPCSHVLAAYWKSLGTPLDDGGAAGDDGMPAGPGQAQGPPGGPSSDLGGAKPNGAGDQPVGVREPAGGQRSFSPDEPPGGPAPAQGPNMPQGPSPIEQTPRAPSTGVIPPNPMEQMQQWQDWQGPGTTDGGQDSPPWAVSVPGAKPQSPFNPMQQPGTYSRFVSGAAGDGSGAFPSAGQGGFTNGQMIRLNQDDWGQAAGPVPGGYGDGEWRLVTRNSVGEVIDQDETTGWIQAIFPLATSGPHEPYHVTMYLDPSQVSAASNIQAPGPVGPRRLG